MTDLPTLIDEWYDWAQAGEGTQPPERLLPVHCAVGSLSPRLRDALDRAQASAKMNTTDRRRAGLAYAYVHGYCECYGTLAGAKEAA
jgi:hypothetical protein